MLAELLFEKNKVPTPLKEIKLLARSIQEAHGKEMSLIENGKYPFPTTFEEFESFIKGLHRNIFASTHLDFAGAFRQGPVHVGLGRNKFEGTPPENLERDMRELYTHAFPTKEELIMMNKDQFLRKCARFMEEVLKIHPFADGNGRITRLCLLYFAHQSEKFRFRLPSDKRMKNKYIDALEYAHRHNKKTVSGEGTKKDPFIYLIKWLDAHLESSDEEISYEFDKPDWIDEIT